MKFPLSRCLNSDLASRNQLGKERMQKQMAKKNQDKSDIKFDSSACSYCSQKNDIKNVFY